MGEFEPEPGDFVGENLDERMERPVARHANRRLRGQSQNTFIDLGELGPYSAEDVRFRDSVKQGFLNVYTRSREYTEEHKVVTSIAVSTVALGAVLTGIAALKHRKK